MTLAIEVKKETLPVITTNFDLVKKALEDDLKKYKNVVVTLETLKADKALAKEIAGKAKEFDTMRKNKLAELSAPLVAFGDQMKELQGVCTNLAQTIKDQVLVFESAKLKEISKLLKDTLEKMRTESVVSFEFRTDNATTGMAKLGSITKNGSLTKASKTALESIVAGEKASMQRMEIRLAKLESESFKQGLTIPLQRANIEHFIFDDDESYDKKLELIITLEYERQVKAVATKKALDEKAVAASLAVEAEIKKELNVPEEKSPEDKRKIGGALLRGNQTQSSERAFTAPTTKPSKSSAPAIVDDKIAYVVNAQFNLKVPARVVPDNITAKLESMMKAAGITTLSNITIEKSE